MTSPTRDRAAGQDPSRRFLPLLLLLFVGSGCAALIYEVVWFQSVQLVIGSSNISLGVLLGTFMGGMCLGSLIFPRYITGREHPLRVYAILELGIALIALLVLYALPAVGRIYSSVVPHGPLGVVLRAMICAVFLLPPTMLMGATLPAIARWVETTRNGVAWLGFFYGGNIAGAVLGCLLAGFYLLRVHDLATATLVGVAVNVAVAAIALVLARVTAHDSRVVNASEHRARQLRGSWPVYVAIGLSGMSALGAEVVWTRVLSLMLGATVYTFSIILAVFLAGLGIGSSAGSAIAKHLERPRVALGWCQMGLAVAIAWTAYMLMRSLPFWPVNPSLATSPWFNLQLDLVRCIWALLPAAVLWGASFPLALASVAVPGQDPGRLVGRVYAANTIGAIVGALGFSIVGMPMLGSQGAQRALIALTVISAVVVLAPVMLVQRRRVGSGDAFDAPPTMYRPLAGAMALGSALVLALLLSRTVGPIPPGLVAYGRYLPTYDEPNIVYLGEGMNSSIAVSELTSGVRNFHVSGKVEASTEPQDMRLQRLLGHVSALLHPKPKTVLVVGFGAGVTAGSFVLHPDVERIVICEIEPLIPQVVSKWFAVENYNVLQDPRVEVVYDDARHYILTTKEKFDVITSDPIHPWVKGAATLYTREYFELARRHLNPGGVITQWVPLYESNTVVVKSELATFFDVFPTGTIWSNDIDGRGYDVVLAGKAEPLVIDIDSLDARMRRPDHARVAASLAEVGFNSATDVLATFGGRGTELAPWLRDAEVNRDRNLRLQYLAGLGLNYYQNARIYDEMLRYRRFPETLFVGSDSAKAALREAIVGPMRP